MESRLEGGSDWQLHAQGDAIPREAAATHSVDLGEVASRCDEVQEAPAGETLRALHEGQLRFGPRWEVLRSMRFGTGEALAHLELAEDFVQDLGSYRLHPALFDLATGFATPLIEGYHGEMLWAPMSYKRVVLHKPLPQRIVSHVRSNKPNHVDEEIAVFDVTILDESGQVLVEVEEFAIRKLAQDAAFAPSRGGNAGSGAAAGAAEGTRLTPTSWVPLSFQMRLARRMATADVFCSVPASCKMVTPPCSAVVPVYMFAYGVIDGRYRQRAMYALADLAHMSRGDRFGGTD